MGTNSSKIIIVEVKEKSFEYHSKILLESNVTDIVCYSSTFYNKFIFGQNDGAIYEVTNNNNDPKKM